MSYWYLATPYALYPVGREAAYRLACAEAARLICAGIPAFSPIAHSHGLPVPSFDHADWLSLDQHFVRSAAGLIVLRAESWEKSAGIAQEVLWFRGEGKPVFYMDTDPAPLPSVLVADVRQAAYRATRRTITDANRRRAPA